MATLQQIENLANATITRLSNGATTLDQHVDFNQWSEAKQALITARLHHLRDQGYHMDPDAEQTILNVEQDTEILFRNAHSIEAVTTIFIGNEDIQTHMTTIEQDLNSTNPEYLFSEILTILAQQIISLSNDLHVNRSLFYFNLVLQILLVTPEASIEAFFDSLADVVKPDDETLDFVITHNETVTLDLAAIPGSIPNVAPLPIGGG